MLVAELFDLLGNLPVHEVALAFGTLLFVLVLLAQNFGAHRAVWREHFFDGAGSKVNTAFCHGRVDDFGCAHERGATGGVIAHAGTTDALFVLLVAQFAGVLVVLQQVDVAGSNATEIKLIQVLGHVAVEVRVDLGAVIGNGYDRRAIRQFFRIKTHLRHQHVCAAVVVLLNVWHVFV